nr:hypothetical protein [uncultured archaeon]
MKNEMKLDELKKEVIVRVPVVRDGNVVYSLKSRRGPSKWRNLRNADYGKNPENDTPFRQLSFPENERLAFWAFSNDTELAKKPVIQAVNSYWLTGNSLVVYTPKDFIGVDFPEESIVAQLGNDSKENITRIAESLKARLGKREDNDVVFSDDGRVRWTKREGIFTQDLSSKSALATYRGNIVLSGSLENADLTSKLADKYSANPKFWASDAKYAVRVPGLGAGGGRLHVSAGGFGNDGSWYSFGGQ